MPRPDQADQREGTTINGQTDEHEISAVRSAVSATPTRWLVTGAAGFIGSHLIEELLRLDQMVTALDNFSTGYRANLDDVRRTVGEKRWSRLRFIEGDICESKRCIEALKGVDTVLHEAALGSVPRSIADPLRTHESNLTGFLKLLIAAKDSSVRRFVYAASSSTYGDNPALPKREDRIGKPLSPYAVTKYANELYAAVCADVYGIEVIGLRYFNVFGPRQDPAGAYAAVIPRWIGQRLEEIQPRVFGDGLTSRDFCYVANVVQANLLAATTSSADALNQVYNVAVGDSTTLNELLALIDRFLVESGRVAAETLPPPRYEAFRTGDVRHSKADISKGRELLGYEPTHSISAGLRETVKWFVENSAAKVASTEVG